VEDVQPARVHVEHLRRDEEPVAQQRLAQCERWLSTVK
jgi:hypothetical protein